MGCGSSKPRPIPPEQGWGQSLELKSILVGGGDGSTSPPPSLSVAEFANETKINGQHLGELFRAGFVQLYAYKDTCNKINVFPIPDGDTGTNMVITLRPAIMSLGDTPDVDIAKTSLLVSGQTTLNAQGNSGTIFSFTFSKLAAAIGEKVGEGEEATTDLEVKDFIACLGEVSKLMQKAMDNPVPGTMLTVIAAAFDEKNFAESKTIGDVIKAAAKAGQAELEETPNKLIVDGKAVLKNFRGKTVVDSGSQGFQYLLDGMVLALDGKLTYGEYLSPGTAADVALDEGAVGTKEVVMHENCDHVAFKYCTECVAEIKNDVEEDDLRSALNSPAGGGALGDSLGTLVTKMSDTCRLAKIHIHSNDPEEVFSRMRRFCKDGHLYKEKAEDMTLQVSLSKHPRKIPNPDDADVGIVFTSCAGIPDDMAEAWREGMVPLIVTVDDDSYKDKRTVSSLQFFNIMRRHDFKKVGTSGWNVDDVGNAIKLKLAKHKEVLVISLPFNLSKGTGNALENAIKGLTEEEKKRVVPYQHTLVSPPEGPIVMRAHHLAATKNFTAAEIKKQLSDWLLSKATIGCLFFQQLDYLRAGGRLAEKDKGILKKLFDYIENNQKSFTWFTDFTEMDKDKPGVTKFISPAQFTTLMGDAPTVMNKMVKGVVAKANASGAKEFDMLVLHAAAPHTTDAMLEATKSKLKIRNVYQACLTAVFGVHGGPGMKGFMIWPADEMEFPQMSS